VLDSIPGGAGTRRGLGTRPSYKPDISSDSAESGKTASPHDPNEDTIAELERTEREVVAHEAAHQAAAGRFGGPATYTYTTGPDGKKYITGGEVSISTPATSDPEEARRNAQQVMKAALAPGDPSGQDIAVAASAAQTAARAARAYSSNVSPRGLWTIQNGYEGRNAPALTLEPAELEKNDSGFEIAA
jgi:hypothetical protein